MKHYSLFELWTGKGVSWQTFTNKEKAIKAARIEASIRKKTIGIACDENDKVIAYCEYPYYLKELPTDWRDITVNRLDKY